MAVTWRQRIAGWAVRGTTVLVVEVPGGWAVRVAVQRALAARGWREATSPADADALLVCGVPGAGWDEVLRRAWAQLPGPRARASVGSARDVDGALDALAAALLGDDGQRADAAARDLVPGDVTAGDDMDPAGMELAGGEDDLRDGLEMDVLRVPLGPVLTCWPAGLVLRTVLSGDVVVRAGVEVLPGAAHGGGGGRRGGEDAARDRAVGDHARRLDAAAQVLRLAGAVDLAASAVHLRDAALDGGAVGAGAPPSPPPPPRTSTTTRHDEGPFPALRRLSAGEGEAQEQAPVSRTSTTTRHEEGPSPALRRLSAGGGGTSRHFDDILRGGVAALRGRVERSRVLAWSLRGAVTSSPPGGAESDVACDHEPQNLGDVGLDAERQTGDDVRSLLLRLLDPDAHDDDRHDDEQGRTRAALDALPERLAGLDVVTARLLVAALDLRTDALDADDLAAFAPRDDEHAEDSAGDEHAHHHGSAHG